MRGMEGESRTKVATRARMEWLYATAIDRGDAFAFGRVRALPPAEVAVAQSDPFRLRFLFHLEDVSPKPVKFLFKPRLVKRVIAVGHFQSNICPILWAQRVERR